MKRVYIFILITLLLFVSSVLVYSSLNQDDIKQKGITLELPISLEQKVTTIKEGLDVAYDLAKRWDENALSTSIIVRFEGKEKLMNQKGRIIYYFAVDNLGILGNLGKACSIEIDLNKQAIVEVETYGKAPDIGHDTPENFYNANIDIKEAFEIVEKKLGKDTLYKYEESSVIIRVGEEVWIFDLYNEENENYSIRIDPIKGEIIDIEEK